MGSSASSITVPTFTGESTFASSFQQVLTKVRPQPELGATVKELTDALR